VPRHWHLPVGGLCGSYTRSEIPDDRACRDHLGQQHVDRPWHRWRPPLLADVELEIPRLSVARAAKFQNTRMFYSRRN
jgi:hypothetical protein